VSVRGFDDAVDAVGDAIGRGERFIVAVGGDDVVHAVVNGILEASPPQTNGAGPGHTDRPVLGVVAGNAPCDFIRTFGLPPDPVRACAHLEGDGLFTIDAARARYRSSSGTPVSRYFVNMAEAGLGASVAARTARLPPWLGRVRRFTGFWLGVASTRPATVTLRGDRRTWEGSAHDVIIANGQYGWDGYRLSPKSWPSDGYADVLVMTGPTSDSYTLLTKAVLGEHLPHRNILEYRTTSLAIESARPLRIHTDGQPVGTTPASFEVLPGALRLKI
jgi:diacylglycerol kinase (ATP)